MDRGDACGSQEGDVYYRPLRPADFEALKHAHAAVFPIDYEDSFFRAAVHGQQGIISHAAVERASSSSAACLPNAAVSASGGGCGSASSEERLVGFVTARIMRLSEVDRLERLHMGLGAVLLDSELVAYVLTLGTAPALRRRGLASSLISLLQQTSLAQGCIAVYLHVIAYNSAAMGLYQRHGFTRCCLLRDFYVLETGRQPDPGQRQYDAYLYHRPLTRSPPTPGLGSYLYAAALPLRGMATALGSAVSTCMPIISPADNSPADYPPPQRHYRSCAPPVAATGASAGASSFGCDPSGPPTPRSAAWGPGSCGQWFAAPSSSAQAAAVATVACTAPAMYWGSPRQQMQQSGRCRCEPSDPSSCNGRKPDFRPQQHQQQYHPRQPPGLHPLPTACDVSAPPREVTPWLHSLFSRGGGGPILSKSHAT